MVHDIGVGSVVGEIGMCINCLDGKRKFLVIGPQFPWGSMACGKRIVLVIMSSLIVCSPCIVLVVIVYFLLGCMYFFRSAV